RLGRPRPFWFVEAGPGTGTLAVGVLTALRDAAPKLVECLELALVEPSAALRSAQMRRLDGARVTWYDASPDHWPTLDAGCIFANELLDAFPVHRLVRRADQLCERYVAVDHGELFEVDGALSTPLLGAQLKEAGIRLREGQIIELNLRAKAWVHAVAQLFS